MYTQSFATNAAALDLLPVTKSPAPDSTKRCTYGTNACPSIIKRRTYSMTTKRKKRHWSLRELERLRQLYPDTKTQTIADELDRGLTGIYQKAIQLGLRKSDEFMNSPASGRKTRDCQDNGHRFQPGHASWNKGKTVIVSNERAIQTQFKPGTVAHNRQPLGFERVTKEGYTERKVAETGITRKDYMGVHVLLWIEHHGPLPNGHVVVFKDGNKKNCTIENLEAIDRKELMRRNTIHRYPKELKDCIRTVAKLKRKIESRDEK
jgi:hypothetical protein